MIKLKKDGRKLRSESTADHILNTAIKIARKGNIDSMSFNSIAKEANIGTRTIFRHFKDQESLQESLDQKLGEEFTRYFSESNQKTACFCNHFSGKWGEITGGGYLV